MFACGGKTQALVEPESRVDLEDVERNRLSVYRSLIQDLLHHRGADTSILPVRMDLDARHIDLIHSMLQAEHSNILTFEHNDGCLTPLEPPIEELPLDCIVPRTEELLQIGPHGRPMKLEEKLSVLDLRRS